jgi:hypothetical protein
VSSASILSAQVRELVSRLLDDADPITLDQALDEAGRLAGEVFDAAERTEREAERS